MRKFAIFHLAFLVPTLDPLPFPFAAHWVFANQAPRTIELGMTSRRAESMVLVLNRRRQLQSTARVAAAVAQGNAHTNLQNRKPGAMAGRGKECWCDGLVAPVVVVLGLSLEPRARARLVMKRCQPYTAQDGRREIALLPIAGNQIIQDAIDPFAQLPRLGK